jgi:hypothetical protein
MAAIKSGGEGQPEFGKKFVAIQKSFEVAFEGIMPWEAEDLRPVHPLLSLLVEWSGRLRLMGGGETPVASVGREKLANWLSDLLGSTSFARILVGGDIYLISGLEVFSTPEPISVDLAQLGEEERGTVSLRVRFGGAEKRYRFNLSEGEDFLAALHLTYQPDIRANLFLREKTASGVSPPCTIFYRTRFTEPPGSEGFLNIFFEEFGGEEDRIRVEILKAIKG